MGMLWGLLILVLSAFPPGEFPDKAPFPNFDKAVHFYLYAQFTLLLIVGFIKQFQLRILHKGPVRSAFLISFFYGIINELLQKYVFSGRSIELFDIAANFSGAIFGILIFYIIYGKPED